MIHAWKSGVIGLCFIIGLLFGSTTDCDTKPGKPWLKTSMETTWLAVAYDTGTMSIGCDGNSPLSDCTLTTGV